MVLRRIVAPHFVAGIEVCTETLECVRAAPIVRYMLGWDDQRCRNYCVKKGWEYA